MAGAERAACKEPELSSAHRHTRITPICRRVIRGKGQSQHRSSTTKDIKKQPRPDEEGRPSLKSVHDPPKRARFRRGGSPVGARARSPQGPPAQGPALGRGALGALSFEGRQGLTLGAPQDWGKQRLPWWSCGEDSACPRRGPPSRQDHGALPLQRKTPQASCS